MHPVRDLRFGAALLLLLALSATNAAGTTHVIVADRDTWLRESAPAVPHGADPELAMKTAGGDRMRALIGFDVSAVPKDVNVVEAFLTLRVTDADQTGLPVLLRPVSGSWEESTATWSNASALFDLSVTAGAYVPTAAGTVRLDVTTLVREWVAGVRSQHGIMLFSASDGEESRIASRETLFALDRPTLQIETASVLTSTDYRVAAGTYQGLALLPLSVSGIGFRPDVVIVRAATSREAVIRTSTMTGNRTKGLESNATTFSGGITSIDADGFTVGLDSRVNGTLATFHWIAFRGEAGRMELGTYSGDGADNRSIGAGLAPDYVVVLGENSEVAIQRFATQATDRSLVFFNDTEKGDRIQDFFADGFQIGKHGSVNASGATYHWVAWADRPHETADGTYVGDNTDNRNITGLGFAPQVVLVKSKDGERGALRPMTVSGDLTLPFTSDAAYADGIQALHADGFQVGTRKEVNESGRDLYWTAFRTPEFADLGIRVTASDQTPAESDSISLTVTVSNAGPQSAAQIVATERVPRGLTYVNHGLSRGSYSTSTGDWSIGTLAPGDSATLVVVARVDARTGGTTITDWVDLVSSDRPDSVAANGADSVSIAVQIQSLADLKVGKSVDDATPSAGQVVHFSVSVENAGPATATGTVLADPLPAGLIYFGHAASRGGYNPGTGEWVVGTLAPGAGATLLLDARVDFGTEGQTIVNVAAAKSVTPADPDARNDADSAAVVVQSADLAVALSVDDADPREGGTVVYTVSLANGGPTGATGVAVDDLLPAGLTFLAAVPSAGSYNATAGRWTVGDVPASQGASLALSAVVDSGTAGQKIDNEASVSLSDQPDPDPANDSAAIEIRVRSADLSATIAVDDAAPREGGAVRFVVEARNLGPDDVGGVGLLSLLPAGLTWTGDTPSRGSYDHATGIWDLGALAAGSAESLAVLATADAGTGGSALWNAVAVTARELGDPVKTNDADSVAVVVQSADLAVAKSGPAATNAGDTISWTVTVTNEGPFEAAGVVVSDSLPPELIWASDTPSQGTYDPGTGLWSVGSLGPGASATLDLQTAIAAGTAGATLSNLATAESADLPDPVGANDSATADVRVLAADLSVEKSANQAIIPVGGTVTYTVTLANAGPDTATAIVVADPVPAGFDYSGHGASRGTYSPATGLWSIPSLRPSGTATLSLTAIARPEAQGQIVWNVARVTAVAQEDPSPGQEADSVGVNVSSAVPIEYADLALTKSVDIPDPREGETVRFLLQLVNQGPDATSGVSVSDLLPAGLVPAGAATDHGSWSAATGLWSVGALGASEVATLTIDARVEAGTAGTPITNSATVASSAVGDPLPLNGSDSVTLTVQSADLRIAADVDDAEPDESQTITFTVRLANGGPDDAGDVAVLDILPAGLSLTGASASQGSYAAGSGIWSIGTLAAADSASLSLIATVDAGLAGSTLQNVASISGSDQGDPSPWNDADTVSVRVRAADLEVTKSVDDPSPGEGDTIVFTVEVTNHGPDDAPGVELTDDLPEGLLWMGDAASAGDWNPLSGTWLVGSLAPGAGALLEITALVLPGTASTTIVNHASVSAPAVGDPVSSNDADSVAVAVAATRGMSAIAFQVPAVARPGRLDAGLYSLALANGGDATVRLQSISFRNATAGPGTAEQLDADLAPAVLYRDDGDFVFEPTRDTPLAGGAAASGRVTFSGLALAISPGATLRLHVGGGPSLVARDGDVLDLSLDAAEDLDFDVAMPWVTGFPLSPAGGVTVDGMVAAQLAMVSLPDADVAQGAVRVLAADLAVPPNGYAADVLTTLRLGNGGNALPLLDIATVEMWADGGDATFDAGAADDLLLGAALPVGAKWVLGGLSLPVPTTGQRVFASIDVAAGAAPGRTIVLAVPAPDGVEVSSGNSGPLDANVSPAALRTIVVPPANIVVSAQSPSGPSLVPGAAPEALLDLVVRNESARAETLLAITLANDATAPPPATPADLDRDWQPLRLERRLDSAMGSAEPNRPALRAQSSFVGGRLAFAMSERIAPGDSATFRVTGGASLLARDGDLLDLRVDADTSFTFSREAFVSGPFPLDPAGAFPVDGLSGAQIARGAVPVELLTGSERSVVLNATIPANGYVDDVLHRLDVVNLGTAAMGTDISRVEAWIDDGDGTFSAVLDRPLGEMAWTGVRWEITGLSETVVAGAGLPIFLTADVRESASPGRTLQLAFPSGADPGIGMASTNDGPVDGPAAGDPQTITTMDRVTLTPAALSSGTVPPDAKGVAFLEVSLVNSYTQARTVVALRVHNTSAGAGSIAQRDASFQRLSLSIDDGDGVYEGAPADPPIGLAFFGSGSARFGALDVQIPGGESRRLYVHGDLSKGHAADGDVLALAVESAEDVEFVEPTAVAAGWPVESGTLWTVDGMIADQVRVTATPGVTLGPGEGPVAALDVAIPANGYADDQLNRLTVVNQGSATPADIAELRLWRDGGDRAFDAGSVDDLDLGAMALFSDRWTHPALAEPLTFSGQRFFVSVTSSAAPADASTVLLSIPVQGIAVASANDGPRDVAVASPNPIVLSTAMLLASLEIAPAASTVDSAVTATMTVRNVHADAAVENVSPSPLAPSGVGTLQLLAGPSPVALALGPGESGAFQWTYRAASSGEVQLAGYAEGTEVGSGVVRRSLQISSNMHQVFLSAFDLDLYAVESMPFSITRGQPGVVPLALTFANPAGEGGSDVHVTGLRVRIEDEAGNGIVPAALMSRMTVNEGGVVYADRTSLETSGAEVDLSFAQPLVVASTGPSGQVTVAIALDVSDSTVVPRFRVKIEDASWIAAADGTSGGPVAVTLRDPVAFPVVSGLARVVAEATRFDVTPLAATDQTAGRGQDGLTMLQATVENPDPSDLAADVRVPSFAVQLLDSAGVPIPSPRDFLDRIRVESGALVHVDRLLEPGDAETIPLTLSPLLSAPVNTPLPLTLSVDIADDAPLGRIRLVLADSSSFEARDANTGTRVPVLYATDPVGGAWLTVQRPAPELAAAGVPRMPTQVDVGSANVPVLRVDLSHPGAAGDGAALVDALVLQCHEGLGGLLPPAATLDRVRVRLGPTEVGLVTNLPAAGDIVVPLAGIRLEAGASLSLEVSVDVEATAGPTPLEIVVPAGGVLASDANLGTAVGATAAAGGGFPLRSGIAQLRVAAREAVAGFEDAMPAVLTADGSTRDVARFTLRNPAPVGAGHLKLASLTVRATDRAGMPLAIGAALSGLRALVDGVVRAEAGLLDPAATTARLVAPDTLTIPPGAVMQISLEMVLRSEAAVSSLRLGIEASDFGLVPPPGDVFGITVSAESGQALPFWTTAGNFSAASLAESWSNFPNPFAAGREETRFVFWLPQPARVWVRLWSLRGEIVRTVVDGASFGAGLHQDAAWDGRNGTGEVVRNGVYVAEIDVRYEGGGGEKLRRKTAVSR